MLNFCKKVLKFPLIFFFYSNDWYKICHKIVSVLRVLILNTIFFRFVQDLVDKNYFKKNPKKILFSVVQLLEHVVIIFNLYQEEEKLQDMYNFLYAVIKPSGLSDSMKLINIIDQWRLRLFRFYVNRQANQADCKLVNNDITNN